MLRFLISVPCVAALLATLFGCGAVRTLAEAEKIDREIRQDRAKHYKYIGDVYFVLGLDYYTLAKEAEDRNDTARAREYAQKAKLYHFIYREMDREVKRLSKELEEGGIALDTELPTISSPGGESRP